jgi:hypothetical protein
VPTVLRIGPYRLFFYSADGDEPPHVHVSREDAVAKYWLDPLRYDHSLGFRPNELRKIQRTLAERKVELLEAWDEFFGQ